jgi:hypothetical protein
MSSRTVRQLDTQPKNRRHPAGCRFEEKMAIAEPFAKEKITF